MVRCAAAVVCLLVALAGAGRAEAQYFGRNKVHYDRLDFRVLQTEHFDIYYYAQEEEATRHAARMAERWYVRYSRLLDHTFTRRQPLVLYASHPHFSQTNATPSAPGEGTGGLTERVKSRIAMPFAAGLGETDHVLGHEIAHAFQIDVAKRVKQDAFTLPGWFIEGMAEYLALGPETAHTTMWLRDAALHKRLPALAQLGEARYFPYRYGHAFWSYLAGRYGDEIVSTAADPHFDSLQYIHSSGAWDASGRRFAMAALSAGSPVLVIVNTERPEQRREVPIEDAGEVYNPSWSPDGRTIALATDRFTTTLDDLKFGPLRIGLLDLATGIVRPLMADGSNAKQVSPQWAPRGEAVYFVSDWDGISNVYRATLASGEIRQVTDVAGGVSGITSTSPSLAVASQAGTLAFSVYRDGRYEIETLDESSALARPVIPMPHAGSRAAIAAASHGTLARLLEDVHIGLPDTGGFVSTRYDDRLRLESVAPPYVGAMTGGGFGGVVRASVGLSFADMLRDRQLQAVLRAGTDIDDLAAQVAYTNRRGRWNWGVAGGFAPSRFLGARRAIERDGELVTREIAHLRYTHQWGGLTAHYHINRAQRFELRAGVRRTGFQWQTVTRVIDAMQNKTLSRALAESAAGRPVHVAEGEAAFVHDTSVSGPTSPVLGQRLRLEVTPALGGLAFADVRVDARRS